MVGMGWGSEEFEEETAVAREFGKCVQLLGALGGCRRELAGGEGGRRVLGGHDGRGSRGLCQEKGALPVRESRGQQLFPSVSLPPPSSISSKTCEPTLVGHGIAALACTHSLHRLARARRWGFRAWGPQKPGLGPAGRLCRRLPPPSCPPVWALSGRPSGKGGRGRCLVGLAPGNPPEQQLSLLPGAG